MAQRGLAMALFGLVVAIPASAVGQPKKLDPAGLLPILSGGSTDALAGALRGYLVRNLPDPLYEAWPGWGATTDVTRGLKWKGQGVHVHPEPIKIAKKDGKWRHIRVTAENPADSLVFDIRDLQQPEPGRIVFTVFLALDARIEYEQQNWNAGHRMYSGSARARFRIKALLQCEFTFQLVSGSLLPDAVIRLRVAHADVNFDNFVMEHIAGVGGEAAKVLGDAARGGLKAWHPGLERGLLDRANAAIEKAADTKEVRISLSDLLKKKGWLPVPVPLPGTSPQ
jgi:hypothetical protein